MADEWGTVGWTAQKPPTAYDNSGLAPWKIPSDVDVVKVTFETHSVTGGRTRGFVQFRPDVVSLTHVPSKSALWAPKWTAGIGQDGIASVNLPATDTPTLTPNPFQYEVVVIVNYKVVERFYCYLPKAVVEVDLLDIDRVARASNG